MLDWARRESLKREGALMASRLRSYPLQLAAQARAAAAQGNWPEASNQWGFCHEYLAQTRQLPDARAQDRAAPEALPPSESVDAPTTELEQKLRQLRRTVLDEMVEATCRLLAEESD